MKFIKSNKNPFEALVQQEQQLHTPSLYSFVLDQRTTTTPDIKLTAEHLNLVMSDNVMKCCTRITKSDFNMATHTPLFLPRQSKLVKLFILYLHNK